MAVRTAARQVAPMVHPSGSVEPAPLPRATRKPMVGWYDPHQLAQTAVHVAISTIFGRHSDHRLVEAMASGGMTDPFYDYTYHYNDDGQDCCERDDTRPRDSIWIDYVGDVGDGWNPTYAIAYHLAQTGLTFTYTDREGKACRAETKRGDLLIFGGDEAYPTASRIAYQERLVGPYEAALRNTGTHPPHAFAIPGNHDWYDSLVAFTRLFTSRRWFAGWRTRQSRSYFALKLPHNWWLLGTDVQLGSDIDGPQVAYFQSLTQAMEEETKNTNKPASIILCHAEPHWIRAAQYGGIDPAYSESNLQFLEKKLGKNAAVFIAGDLHHYRRHEARDHSRQKITAGGGVAFLHATHVGRLGKRLTPIIEPGLAEERVGSTADQKGLDQQRAEPYDHRIFDLKTSGLLQRFLSSVILGTLPF
jgi:Calcineurin-like phosphoesterase